MLRRVSGKRGFTLVEILVVIAIIGIVASVIVGLRPGNPRGLEDARRIISSEFRVAQSKALLGGNPDRDPAVNERFNFNIRRYIVSYLFYLVKRYFSRYD